MEKLLYYVWEYCLFDNRNNFIKRIAFYADKYNIKLSFNVLAFRRFDIFNIKLSPYSRFNRKAVFSPDFFNAKIRIGEKLWAGNVEIHKNASDWKLHNHDHDKSYDSVILHVIENNDAEIVRSTGEIIPQLIIRYPDRQL